MNCIQRKIYLYNVTFGLYMLDWWERYLFNILMIVLLWFIFYNGSHVAAEFYRSCILSLGFAFTWFALFCHLKTKFVIGGNLAS